MTFDLTLCALILTTAVAANLGAQVFRSVVFFIVYGLLVAVAWVRLGAVDVALAEGAIGAGLTGVLLLSALGRLPVGARAVLIDIGARRGGYISDITRMAVLGAPPDGYDAVHAVVDQAVQAALAAIRPGVSAKSIDTAARDVIAQAGYGEFFTHRVGHGVGTEVHEMPWMTSSNGQILAEGMVFTIEPGIYLPGRFGARLEEVAVVTATGARILSDLSRDLHIA